MLSKAEIQRLRSLHEKKHRDAEGMFVVEGEKVISELLAEGFPLHELYVTDGWSGRVPSGMTPLSISDSEMERISHFPTPSSAFAVVAKREFPVTAVDLKQGLTLALDRVQDAGNVGTILRIADWYGFTRVLLSPDCADVYGSKVINASKASFSRVRFHVVELPSVLSGCGVPVLGCDLEGASVHSLAPLENAVVIIGSEGRGLSASVASCVTQRVTIPRYGRAESLNAGVAAGVICDQLRRSPPVR